MTFNDLTLLLTAVISAGLVLTVFRLDEERLYSVIITFLILISIVGTKTGIFFGHTATIGNVFYASVFLATYFLIERHGRREGIRTIVTSVVGITFFSVLLELAVVLQGAPTAALFNANLSSALQPAPRIAFSVILAYIFSQGLNLTIYLWLKQRFGRRYLWLRANVANAFAQIFASIIFVGLTFHDAVPPSNLLEIVLSGIMIKIVFMMITAPLLYLNRMESEKEQRVSTLILR